MLEQEIKDSFNMLISKIYNTNKNVHNKTIANDIYLTLISENKNNNQLFYDNFKHIQIDDKSTIVNICIATVINKIFCLLNQSNIDKLTSIVNYIDNNRSLVLSIPTIMKNNTYDKIPTEIRDVIKNLNIYEKLFIISICYNVMEFSPKTVEWNIKFIQENKDEFFSNISKYKNIIIQLLCFYTPIYSQLNNISNSYNMLNPNYDKDYIKIYSITDILKNQIKLYSKYGTINSNVTSIKALVYYIIYQFLICKNITEENNDITKKVYDMLKENNFDMSLEVFNHLLECCTFSVEYCSLEEQINEIINIKDSNINEILSLYAKLDIGKYNKLEQKKKAFGLK